ncbi:ABC transporter permease [Paenibacillus endoradicis]|uniref:ABC transporter permease n=1 Tax=Paenibacillus endoradicis TaxID=2972487 RepID=UPI002158BAAF|nr:ABC transporter permease [Paenibacillus endoradicis]MCR8657188.1 ABC transporter permease [Paenibacillus endoradicis]
MSNFMKLVQNESQKLYKKKSFFIAYAIMAIMAIAAAIIINQTVLRENIGAIDFVNLILGLDGFGSIFVLIAIIFTASIVTIEHQLGTIKFLLIRAHSRSTILASKYVTLILYITVLLAFTTVIALIMGMLLLDTSNLSMTEVIQNLGSTLLYTIVYATIMFMFGVLTRSMGATIGIGLVLNFVEGILVMLLSRYEWAKYTLFLNTNLSAYKNGGAPMEGMTLAFSSMMIALYMALFLAISFTVFNKRDI